MIQAKGLQVRIVTECGRYITGPAGLLISRVTHRKKIYKNYVSFSRQFEIFLFMCVLGFIDEQIPLALYAPWHVEVGLDACMANLMRPGMYNAYHHITIVPNGEQVPGLPDRNQEMPDNSKDLISKTGIYDVVGGLWERKVSGSKVHQIHRVLSQRRVNGEILKDSLSPRGLCENNDKFAVDRALNADPRPGDVAVIHDSGAHGHSMGFNYNGKPRSAEQLGTVGPCWT